MNTHAVSQHSFPELRVGMSYSFEVTITREDVDALARISGDVSPIHMDADYARSKGFADRVVHGVLLGSYASRMVGVHLPGRNSLLLTMQITFSKPSYIGDTVQVTGIIQDMSPATNTVTVSTVLRNLTRNYVTAKCKATVLVAPEG